jgi:hypothetical protein
MCSTARSLRLLVRTTTKILVCIVALLSGHAAGAADYSKRAQTLDPSIKTRLMGRWSNPVDHVVIEFTSVDLESGQVRGKEWPTSGQASGSEHDLVGWVSAAPPREGFDNVVPVSFSTTLFEYGTLPVWAGFLRGYSLVTMHYLVWPNRAYSWDHISSFQESWTKEAVH